MSKHFLLFVLACLVLAGCSKSFDVGDDQWPVVKSGSVSEKAFRDAVVGHGWKSGVTYTMKDGRITDEKYHQAMTGSTPVDYYFGENERITFISPDWYPVNGFYRRNYEYRPEECAVYVNGNKSMVIVRVDKDSFAAIECMGWKSNGAATFGYTTYYRMTDSELADAHAYYSTDLDTFRE